MKNTTTFSAHPHYGPVVSEQETDATIEAFRWLLIFGFPAAVAAARLMPDQFSEAFDDAVQLARRVTRNPFGHKA